MSPLIETKPTMETECTVFTSCKAMTIRDIVVGGLGGGGEFRNIQECVRLQSHFENQNMSVHSPIGLPNTHHVEVS